LPYKDHEKHLAHCKAYSKIYHKHLTDKERDPYEVPAELAAYEAGFHDGFLLASKCSCGAIRSTDPQVQNVESLNKPGSRTATPTGWTKP